MAELKWEGKLKEKVVIDTNLLLDDSKILFKLTKEYKKIVIPITVLKELDKHKFKQATSFSARQAIRALIEFKTDFADRIVFDTDSVDVKNDDSNDCKIIRCTQRHDAVLATKDMSMGIIAEAQGVKTKLCDVVLNNIYDPYVYIEQAELFKYNDEGTFGYGRLFENEEYYSIFRLFEQAGGKTLIEDAWFFVIINTPTSNPTVYANNPIRKIFVKIDDDPKYRQLIIDRHAELKALDIYQTCAIYAMIEAPNTLLCGSYGSGKSLLSTAYSLSIKGAKTFISRPNLTVDRRFELGFLPGPQPLDAKVLTPLGWSTMGEVSVGDLVIGRDGKSYKVENTYDMGIKDVYEISTTNGGKTKACGDHVWATKTHNELKHNKDFQIRTTLDIKNSLINYNSGDKYNHTLPMCGVVNYDVITELPIKPYTVGVLLGDGSFSNSISFSSIDGEIIDRVKNEVEEFGMFLTKYGISYTISEKHAFNKPARPVIFKNVITGDIKTYKSTGDASSATGIHRSTVHTRCIANSVVDNVEYSFGEKKRWKNRIKNSVYELGLEGTKAATKFIPDIYKYSSIENRVALLQGLMDTDGTIKETTGEQSYTTISIRLAKDVVEVCRSLGINATYYIRDRMGNTTKRPSNGGDIVTRHISYEVSVPKSNNIDIFYLKRKADRIRCATRNRHVKIKDITYIGKELVKCIKINSVESLYVTDDFIVTHNTMEDKLFPWMTGVLSGLYHIYSNTRGQVSDKLTNGSAYDFVKDTIFKKNFEMLSLETIQGMSFMDGELLLLDETQLCSISVLSVILSRFGKGSKLIATGDIKQTYGTIPPAENGLLKLMRLMPSKHIAYVTLKNNYRSELLELADKLQDNTLY